MNNVEYFLVFRIYLYSRQLLWISTTRNVAELGKTGRRHQTHEGHRIRRLEFFVLVSLPFGRRRRKRKTRERERERTVHRSALTRVPPRATLLEYWTKSDRADYSHLIRLCLTPNLPLFFRWLWSQLMPFTLYEAPFPVWIGKPKKG